MSFGFLWVIAGYSFPVNEDEELFGCPPLDKKKYFEILATLFMIQFSPCCHSTLFWLVRCSTFAVLSPHFSIIILPSRFCWQSTIFSLSSLSSHWLLLYSSNLNERDTYFGVVIERERERERVCDGVAALPIEQEFEIFINSPFAKHHRFTWRRFYSGYLRRIEKLKRSIDGEMIKVDCHLYWHLLDTFYTSWSCKGKFVSFRCVLFAFKVVFFLLFIYFPSSRTFFFKVFV